MRRITIVATVAWLAAGLAGTTAYVRAYEAHRGFGAPRTPPGIPQGTLRVVSFRSPAIGRTERYLVYLPPGYAAAAARGTRFPVLYLRDVDRRFATLPRRADRAIGGDSEGAYGAVNVALHHLGLFSVVESWSGYYWQTRTTVFARSPAAAIEANSPAAEVRSLGPRIRRLGLRAYLFQGRQDENWALWRAQTPRMLTFASRWFA
jgi:S-formylglutathione hydrolase FrmB